MVWIFATILFVLGSWLIGQGIWIHVKAVAAQWLLRNAWAQTLATQQPIKPWPWADTWPIGHLMVPRLGINQIILADASGRSLAFGPGKVGNGKFPDGGIERLTLSGHRDTHFSFVRDVQRGDRMTVQIVQGDWFTYVVEDVAIVDSRIDQLIDNQEEASLRLITCYPFDALLPGGPLRYVVTATRVLQTSIPHTPALARGDGGCRGSGRIGRDF